MNKNSRTLKVCESRREFQKHEGSGNMKKIPYPEECSRITRRVPELSLLRHSSSSVESECFMFSLSGPSFSSEHSRVRTASKAAVFPFSQPFIGQLGFHILIPSFSLSSFWLVLKWEERHGDCSHKPYCTYMGYKHRITEPSGFVFLRMFLQFGNNLCQGHLIICLC